MKLMSRECGTKLLRRQGVAAAVTILLALGAAGCEEQPVLEPAPNRMPQAVGSIPANTILAGESMSLNAAAYFRDPDGDELIYSATSADTVVARVDVAGSTVTVVGVARGPAIITVTATDPGRLSIQQTFIVTVPNQAPRTVGSIPANTIAVGDSATVNAASYFRDPDDDALSYTVSSSDTTSAAGSVRGSTVTVVGVGTGSASITVTATDPDGATAQQSFTVTVPNQAPDRVGSMPDVTIRGGGSVSFDPAPYFTDPDGDELIYSATSADTAVASVSVAFVRGRAIIIVIPRRRGGVAVTVTATDPGGLRAGQSFTVTVPNQAPDTVGSMPDVSVAVDDSASLNAAAYFSDPDGDALFYSAASSNDGVAMVSLAGSVLTVLGFARDSATVTVTATDPGRLSVQQTFIVTVPNQAPRTVGSIPANTIAVGDSATVNAASYFRDPDGDELTYKAASSNELVAGVNVVHSMVTLLGVGRGSAAITVTATDPDSASAQQSLTVTVPNQAPDTVGSIPNRTFEIGDSLALNAGVYFSDPDGDPLTYSATSADSAIATVSAADSAVTIVGAAKGTAIITLTATDPDSLIAQQRFTVTLANRPPEPVGSIPAAAIRLGTSVSLDPAAYFSDADGDELTYGAEVVDNRVATASVVRVQDTVSISFMAVGKGRTAATVTATDPDGLRAGQSFTVTVPNQTPDTVGSMPAATVAVGDSVSLNAAAYFRDPDGDELIYSATSADTVVARVDVAGSTVTVVGVGKGSTLITTTATDPASASVRQTFIVTVPNQAPQTVGSIPANTIAVGDSATVNAAAYFSDPDGDELAYFAVSSDTAVATVSVAHSTVAMVSGVKGRATVTVTATDPASLSAQQRFTVTVPNQAPDTVGFIAIDTVEVGDSATVNVAAYFRDADGDPLSYRASSADTAVAAVSVAGSMLTVLGFATGDAIVTVTATDPDSASAEQSFTVTVPNHPPDTVGSIAAGTIAVGDSVSLNAAAYFSDPDGHELTYSAEAADTAVAAVTVADSAVTIVGAGKGSTLVTVTATDPYSASAEQSFTVTVPNQAPDTVGSIADDTIAGGDSATVNGAAYFSDPDGDPLTYTATSADSAIATVIAADSAILTVAAVRKGSAIITVTATDPDSASAQQSFTVTVPNQAPDTVGFIPIDTVAVGDSATLNAAAYFRDPDGDPLSYRAASADTAVASVSVAGSVLTVLGVARDSATVTLTATDPDSASAQQSFTVTVPNQAPVLEERPWGDVRVEIGASLTLNLASYFTDPDGDELTYSLVATGDTAVAAVSLADSVITVVGVARASVVLTARATDPYTLWADRYFRVNIANDRPRWVNKGNDTLSLGDSATFNVAPYFTDPDGDELTYSITGMNPPSVATASLADSLVTIVAVAKGKAYLGVLANDPYSPSAWSRITITVPNSAPRAHWSLPWLTIELGGDSRVLNLETYFSDPDGDPLTYSATAADTAVAAVSLVDSVITVVGVGVGDASITVTATDSDSLSSAAVRLRMRVRTNQGPETKSSISDKSMAVGDSALTDDMRWYFRDMDGDELIYVAESSDTAVATVWAHGFDSTVMIVATGVGSATITVDAYDLFFASAQQTFQVTVTAASQPPAAAGSIPGRSTKDHAGPRNAQEPPGGHQEDKRPPTAWKTPHGAVFDLFRGILPASEADPAMRKRGPQRWHCNESVRSSEKAGSLENSACVKPGPVSLRSTTLPPPLTAGGLFSTTSVRTGSAIATRHPRSTTGERDRESSTPLIGPVCARAGASRPGPP